MLYRTGNIEIDTVNFQLSENGDSLSVEPQVFDLIVYLLTNRDRLVSRQEIFDNLWSGRIVSDTSLSNHIKSVRKALGDDGQKQQVIKTVHGRGYQFIAPVEEAGNISSGKPEPTQGYDEGKSIAVLAFSDLSPKQDQEYFSDGLSEELINLLAKIPELRVISRTSSFSFKGKKATTEEIGRQLKVNHILEGSVRKAGNHLRITTQLIKVSDESHLWSETFNENMDDVFRVQDDIALAVIKRLKITLLDDMAKTTVVNPDAYTLYLEAKYLGQQYTSESCQKAEKIIHESISIDAGYAPSWNLLGSIIQSSSQLHGLKSFKESHEQAYSAVQKAIELDSEYALAYSSLALLQADKWDFEKAEYNIQKAVSLDHANSSILNHAAIVTMYSGRIEKAIALLHQAIKLDPIKICFPWNLGLNHLMLNQLDEAINIFNRIEHLWPDGDMLHSFMAWILIEQGDYTEAMKEADLETHEFWRLYAKNAVFIAQGNRQQADPLLDEIIEKYGETYPSYIAYLYAFRVENDFAFEWLEKSLGCLDPNLIEQINFPAFRNLNDPRWGVFLQKLGLPEDHWLMTKADLSV